MSATRLELVEVFKHIARKIEKLNKALPCEPKELPDAQVDELHAYEEAQEDVIRFVHDRTGIDRWDLSEAVFRVGTSFGLSAHTRRSKRTPENPTLTTDENRQLEQLEALQNRGEHRDLTWILPKLKELDRDEVAQSKLMEVFQNYPDIAKELRLIQNGEDKAATPEGEWSAPMSKAEIARKVTGDHSARPRKIEALLRQWLYQPVPGKNQGRVRLDLMDAHSRKKLEKS